MILDYHKGNTSCKIMKCQILEPHNTLVIILAVHM